MKEQVQKELDILLTNYPELTGCLKAIQTSFGMMRNAYLRGGVIMACGNGGSASDAEHIVSELMKGFKLQRPLTGQQRDALVAGFPDDAAFLADNLQQAIPAISIVSQTSISTAFANDVAPDMVFAQQVFGYGRSGDALLGLSTSGNARNVVNACKVAKSFGIGTIGMTGQHGGKLREICDVTICVPATETFRVQEYHLPVYHTLCAMLEMDFFQ